MLPSIFRLPKPANELLHNLLTIWEISTNNWRIFWRSLNLLLSNVDADIIAWNNKTGKSTLYLDSSDFNSLRKLSIFLVPLKYRRTRGVSHAARLEFPPKPKTACKLNKSCSSKCGAYVNCFWWFHFSSQFLRGFITCSVRKCQR